MSLSNSAKDSILYVDRALLFHPQDPQRVLLIQRGNKTVHWPEHFEFAGGGRDDDFGGAENIVKEVKEESGLLVQVVGEVPFQYQYTVDVPGSPLLGRTLETHYWLVTVLEKVLPEIQLEQDEALSYQWALWQDLLHEIITPQTRYAVQTLTAFR